MRYAFDNDRSLNYNYMHNSYRYSYHDPFTYITKLDGTPTFEGTIRLSSTRYIPVTPSDYLGYHGEREQDIHKLRYEDAKNEFKMGVGYSDTPGRLLFHEQGHEPRLDGRGRTNGISEQELPCGCAEKVADQEPRTARRRCMDEGHDALSYLRFGTLEGCSRSSAA